MSSSSYFIISIQADVVLLLQIIFRLDASMFPDEIQLYASADAQEDTCILPLV
jgi:hypothetical protein